MVKSDKINFKTIAVLCSTLAFSILFFIPGVNGQQFLPIQDSSGINHVFYHTTFLGGGSAFFDYDNDGDDDLYVTSGKEMDKLYRNNGDGTFEDVSFVAGLLTTKFYYTMGVVAGDIDNDGFQDLFVTTEYSDFSNPSKNLLFKNLGNGTFLEIWDQDKATDNRLSIGAIMVDIDLDGLLDIFVYNYVDETSFIFDTDGNIIGFEHECYPNNLYINTGNGKFEDRTFTYGLQDEGCALAAIATDFDFDGDSDIYIANDFGEFVLPNRLFENLGPGKKFAEIGNRTKSDYRIYGMGVTGGDIDNDLDIDYYITNYGQNMLMVKEGDEFTEKGIEAGVDDTFFDGDSLLAIGWGTTFLDIDNDGDLDLFVGNGYVPGPDFIPSAIRIPDKLFLNDGTGIYTDVTTSSGIENRNTTRGVSYSDYDNDGDLDILCVVLNVPMSSGGWKSILFQNQGTDKNWVQIKLEGTQVNRDAYGSRIYLHSDDHIWVQELYGGSSHASMNSNILHFGIDTLTKVDSLVIHWTGGTHIQIEREIPINQRIKIKENEIETPTAVIKTTLNNQILIFPNPAKEILNVKIGGGFQKKFNAEIMDTNGRLIDQKSYRNTDQIYFDISQFSPGIYFLVITSDFEIEKFKFIKI